MSTKRDLGKHLDKLLGPRTIASTIRSTRECAEMTQAELGLKMGVSKQYVCNVESGRRAVDVGQAIKFAKALGMLPEVFANIAVEESLRKYKMKLEGHVRAA